MVIKITPVNSAHGGDAINYDMEKDKARLIKLHFLEGTSFGFSPSPDSVYQQMKLHQVLSGKKCKDPFFRIEVCPSVDESKNWTMKDWQKLCDDTIIQLAKQGIDLRNTQLICVLHRDTDKWHLHIVANRVAMDDCVINAWQCKNKAHAAADTIAKERGWKLASETKKPVRKSKIRQDALNILSSMEKFDMREFFNRMRARGYIIDDRWARGKCVGYSIGEDKEVMFKSSTITGRDLMPSRIEETWKKLHATPMVTYEYTTDYGGKIPFSVPKEIDSVIQEHIEVPEEIWDDDDLNWDEDWDDELADRQVVASGAAAILVGLMRPDGTDGSSVGSGGGGVHGELSRWDGLETAAKDDYIMRARQAASLSSEYYRPRKVSKRRGWKR